MGLSPLFGAVGQTIEGSRANQPPDGRRIDPLPRSYPLQCALERIERRGIFSS
jgi:hypothetical protein